MDLLKIIEHRSEYNPIAIEAIVDEIKYRGLSERDVIDYQQNSIVEEDTLFRNENFVDLNMWQKFFLFFIPVWNIWYLATLSKSWFGDKYYLKIKRGKFFTYSGLTTLFISSIIQNIINVFYFTISSELIVFTILLLFDFRLSKDRKQKFINIYGNST